MAQPLIILGASARAAAESARRADFDPWCVDLFADRDLQAIAPVRRCPSDRYPAGMLDLVEGAPDGPVLLTGALENYPDVLAAIAQRRPLLGSPADSIRNVREPAALNKVPITFGLRFPQVCLPDEAIEPGAELVESRRWLLKPCRSAGGIGIEPWVNGHRLLPGHFLQEYIAGTPISAVFAANGDRTRLLGVTKQLIGDPDFGASGFRYCGNIGSIRLDPLQESSLAYLSAELVRRFDLRGLFGVDAVIDDDQRICPVEVNPRYTASVELLERSTGIAFLGPLETERSEATRIYGKAILFAKQDVTVPDLYDFMNADSLADVPAIGYRVTAGAPICTIFASGPTDDQCLARLKEHARERYACMGQ